MKRKRVSTHITSLPMRLVVLGIGILVAFIHAMILRTIPAGETAFPVFLLALVLLFDAFLVWWGIIFMTQSRITLYEEGIELERGNSKIFTPWENVSHLGIKGGGKNSRRGIFLHEKVTPEVTGAVERLLFGRATNFIPIGRYVHLPRKWNLFSREINTDKLGETDFGQDLYELAPHLFEEYDEWKPKNRLRDDYYKTEYDNWSDDMKLEQKDKIEIHNR